MKPKNRTRLSAITELRDHLTNGEVCMCQYRVKQQDGTEHRCLIGWMLSDEALDAIDLLGWRSKPISNLIFGGTIMPTDLLLAGVIPVDDEDRVTVVAQVQLISDELAQLPFKSNELRRMQHYNDHNSSGSISDMLSVLETHFE